jgi:hypothetical protein
MIYNVTTPFWGDQNPVFGGLVDPSFVSFVRCSLTIYGLIYPLVLYSMVSGGVFLS